MIKCNYDPCPYFAGCCVECQVYKICKISCVDSPKVCDFSEFEVTQLEMFQSVVAMSTINQTRMYRGGDKKCLNVK